MADEMLKAQIEQARAFWADIARQNGWHTEPFYVQVWLDSNGYVVDSVSHRDMNRDYVIDHRGDVID